MKARVFLLLVVFAGAMSLVSFAGGKSEASAGLAGSTVNVATNNSEVYAWFQEVSSKVFTPKTGIKVVYNWIPEYRSKKYVMLQAGETSYDVYKLDAFEVPAFVSNNWLVQLDSYVAKDYLDSQLPGLLAMNRTLGGKLWGTSYMDSGEYWYYNAAMLQKLGKNAPPKTWDELYADLKAAKSAGIVQSPFAEMWPDDITFERVMANFGVQLFDAHGNATFNTPTAVKVLDFMKKLQDEGLATYYRDDIDQVRKAMSAGDALFSVNWDYQTLLIEDPKESKVVGQTKLMMSPGPDAPGKSIIMDEGLGLSSFAPEKNRKAAVQWMEWLGSPEVQKMMILKYGWFTTAKSPYNEIGRAHV
jgi:multiple sugar transport system substrate-binding protein